VEDVIQHDSVRGISLTGSESAGRQVAANAGRQLKPVILELGGSNAFIVLPDADLNLAVEHAIIGRFQNNGQSCIAAKRFLVHADVFDRFIELFKEKIEALKMGDPLDPTTYISTLVNQDAAEAVQSQVNDAVRKGARILCGGKYQNAVYYPTLLVDVTLDMRCMTEEVFGPVAPVMKITSLEEAMEISNNSRFGLGVSIFTQNRDAIVKKVDLFNEGAVFINSLVKSDTRLPFGGVKNSGYGRELSIEGIDEFVNRKTFFIS
jgi:succinate-semialdehyde dehydrogenase/glutarate-semialdehyde dehydrogenase